MTAPSSPSAALPVVTDYLAAERRRKRASRLFLVRAIVIGFSGALAITLFGVFLALRPAACAVCGAIHDWVLLKQMAAVLSAVALGTLAYMVRPGAPRSSPLYEQLRGLRTSSLARDI